MKQPDELSKSQVNQAIQSYEKLFNYPKTNQELNALKKTFYGNYQKLIELITRTNRFQPSRWIPYLIMRVFCAAFELQDLLLASLAAGSALPAIRQSWGNCRDFKSK